MKLNEILEKALDNVEDDRKDAKQLLNDVSAYLGQSQGNYREVGMVAAKYLEVSQRSNEQLVKIAEMLRKANTDDDYGELDDSDVSDIYDSIEDDSVKEEQEDGK